MSTAWLGLGSNVNAEANILAGIRELEETFSKVSLSPVYASTAVGFSGDDFINLLKGFAQVLADNGTHGVTPVLLCR